VEKEGITMNKELPGIMWVVTKERTRVGKPPLKIRVIDYQCVNGKAVGIKAGSQRASGEKIYPLPDCHASLVDARSALEKLAAQELHNDQAKLNKLRSQLQAAKRAAAGLVA